VCCTEKGGRGRDRISQKKSICRGEGRLQNRPERLRMRDVGGWACSPPPQKGEGSVAARMPAGKEKVVIPSQESRSRRRCERGNLTLRCRREVPRQKKGAAAVMKGRNSVNYRRPGGKRELRARCAQKKRASGRGKGGFFTRARGWSANRSSKQAEKKMYLITTRKGVARTRCRGGGKRRMHRASGT